MTLKQCQRNYDERLPDEYWEERPEEEEEDEILDLPQ